MVTGTRVAIIPARGGSKRLPNKNILKVGGEPMIVHTVRAAQRSQQFDHVHVSTDSQEIADVVLKATGLEVPFLRSSAADDTSNVSEAVVVALDELRDNAGMNYDEVVMLMANCPLRDADDIRAGVSAWKQSGQSQAMSCFRFGWMNPWWAFEMDRQGRAAPKFPEALKSRSQDLADLYCPTGAIWCSEIEELRSAKTFNQPGTFWFELAWQHAIDVDDEDDLHMVEALFEMRQR